MSLPHITICICTCGRPGMLERLLREIARQNSYSEFTFSVVVTDNDASQSARPVVERRCWEVPQAGTSSMRSSSSGGGSRTGAGKTPSQPLGENPGGALQVTYSTEAERNIALARNTALRHATGEFIVFIDDDEFPVQDWLARLFRTCGNYQVAGVLGPVKPHFAPEAPSWIVKGGFFDHRLSHPTGFAMPWEECRTGNVLFRHSILEADQPAFRREFGTGGEDQDFFRRMIEKGHRFVWCDEAVAYEEVLPSRWSRRVMLSRALLRGRNTLRHGRRRGRNLMKSALAIPLYSLMLPVLLLAGHHWFMRYLCKLTDHVGRFLTCLGLNPVRERRM
jgi:succinoglycan biosynthesis protein ExoM